MMRWINRGECKRTIMAAVGLMMIIGFVNCASRPDTPIYNIQKDKSYNNQDTIGIIQVKMIDKTFSLESYMPILVVDQRYPLYLVDENLQPLEWMMWHYWKTRERANYFEAVCLVKAQPGSYGISNLLLEKQKISNFDPNHQVNVPVNKTWRFPSHRLAYLGELHVEFFKRRVAADGQGSYQYNVKYNNEEKNLMPILNRFKQAYPNLFSQYENNLQILKPMR